VGKEKRHKGPLNREHAGAPADSLEALLAESRLLRQQMSNDLSREARQLRRMSRKLRTSRRSKRSDKQFA